MSRPYPREFRENVVAVAHRREQGVTLEQIAGDFGVHPTTLSRWLRRPDVDAGVKAGESGDQSAELREARKRIRLVERDREMERIGELLTSARVGRGGELVVEGPAGIGKTVLLAAGRDVAVAQGFRVLRARGAELEREFAFGVVYQLFEPVMAAASEEERRSLLDGPPGVAARLLGLPGPGGDPASAAAVAPDPSFAVLHGLYWLCVNLAADGPLALVVDDAHWVDGPSLRFLAFLLPRLEELRVAVLLGARPAEGGRNQGLLDALTMDPSGETITVAPLSAGGVAALVAAGLGVEPEAEFSMACWKATGGMPFLVRTLLEALRHERIAPVQASAASVQDLATGTLDRWAMMQLVRLGSDAGRLARAVAVLERGELDQLARLAGLCFSDAASAAELLIKAGVLDEAPLGFIHPLLRTAVYRDITINERAKAHSRAARLLARAHASPARVAEHLLATIPTGDEWTVEQLQGAAREAAGRGAPESSVAYLRRALSEPPRQELEGGMLLDLGLAEFSAGQPGWHDHLRGAIEAATDDTTRIAAALLFANALRWHERTAEAIEVCDGVADRLAGRNPEGRLTLEAMAVVCGVLDATTAQAVSNRTNDLLLQAKERSVPRQCLAAAAYVAALLNEPADQVADLVLRALAAGTQPRPDSGDPPWLPGGAFRHPSAVVTLMWAERFDAAQALADAAVSEAQASANGIILPAVMAQRAWLGLRRGDLTAAEADARALLEAPGSPAPPILRNRAISVLVDVLVERGELQEAEQTLESVAADLAGRGVTAHVLRHSRGRLRFAQGRFGEALGDFRAAGEVTIGAVAPSPCYLPWRSDAALAILFLGEPEAARRLSDEEVELARAFGAPRVLGVALRAAGIVVGGQDGETLLREAIAVLVGPDTRLENARAQADLGALLRRRNRRVDARQLLRQAVDTAHHLGATALAERAETELRSTGAKSRRVRLTGLEALTASERRIAELAANGLTNREIAQTLFITDRTVEAHLTHVFTKLGVRTRTSLPAALATTAQATRA
jgi:DNA-binding CsgD family transcriptional regulator/transposase-like protein